MEELELAFSCAAPCPLAAAHWLVGYAAERVERASGHITRAASAVTYNAVASRKGFQVAITASIPLHPLEKDHAKSSPCRQDFGTGF
jgi:hypothetical protein